MQIDTEDADVLAERRKKKRARLRRAWILAAGTVITPGGNILLETGVDILKTENDALIKQE